MGLSQYNRMRDFSKTKEPAGELRTQKNQTLRSLIQKHDASHLHYDFRLESDLQ